MENLVKSLSPLRIDATGTSASNPIVLYQQPLSAANRSAVTKASLVTKARQSFENLKGKVVDVYNDNTLSIRRPISVTNTVSQENSNRGDILLIDCKFRASGGCGTFKGYSMNSNDFIKHLFKRHFNFDNLVVTEKTKIRDMLKQFGNCKCGYHGAAVAWLNDHVLNDQSLCPLISKAVDLSGADGGTTNYEPRTIDFMLKKKSFSSRLKRTSMNGNHQTRPKRLIHRVVQRSTRKEKHQYDWPKACNFQALGKCGKISDKIRNCYVFRNHMFNRHFTFDDVDLPNDDLRWDDYGTCECGYYDQAKTWWYDHILSEKHPCPLTTASIDPEAPTTGKCTVCGRNFEANLQQHIKSHRDDWQNKCIFQGDANCGLFDGTTNDKVHMFMRHFLFDNLQDSWKATLSVLFKSTGRCKCGFRGTGESWINEHVMAPDNPCPLVPSAFAPRPKGANPSLAGKSCCLQTNDSERTKDKPHQPSLGWLVGSC